MTSQPNKEAGRAHGSDAGVLAGRKPPLEPRRRRAGAWRTAAVMGATIASVLLIKWAFDVFLVLVLLACLAVVLHVGSKLAAESELLSPAWIVIILCLLATGVWLFTPSDTLDRVLRFERYFPKAVGDFLEWSAERGWAQRALVAPRPGGTADVGAGTGALSGSSGGPGVISAPPTGDSEAQRQPRRAAIALTVTASPTAVRAGQAVTLTATLRFSALPAANASTTVRFLDGGMQIGAAAMQLSGTIATASYTTTALLLGEHTIRARYAGPGLFGTVTSNPVTVTVTQ